MSKLQKTLVLSSELTGVKWTRFGKDKGQLLELYEILFYISDKLLQLETTATQR